jgi:hypothetical protein
MATSKSAIAAALAKRFGPGAAGRRNLLRTLGLAADDLAAPAPGGGSGGGGDDRLRALRVEIENALGEMKNLPEGSVAKILATLDKHVRLDKLPDDDPQAEAVGAITGDDELETFREFCRARGMGESDIAEAIRLAQGGAPAADRLPVSGPGGQGGHLSDRTRAPGEPAFAADEARSRVDADLDRMFGTARVGIGFDTRQPRRKVSVPTAKVVADFNAMYGADGARFHER